jgi:hypothetical protein
MIYHKMKNRFCYHYKAPGFIEPTCKPLISASSSYLSSISCTTSMSGQTQSALLYSIEQRVVQAQTSTLMCAAIQNTIQNTSSISNQLYSQLLQVGAQRYTPYQPYVYPVIPSSVTQLQMATVNVGVPVTPITCLTGKGNQTVIT